MKAPSFSYYTHDGPAAVGIELTGALAAEDAKEPSRSFFRDVLPTIGLLLLLTSSRAPAQSPAIIQATTNESLAFARYIARLDARGPFTESGPVALAVVASLPGLDKQGRLLAIRDVGKSERSEYGIVELQGDSFVFDRVIAPYFAAQRQAEDLPLSSVTITPRNYKFRYAGAVKAGDSAAYIFRITPRTKRAGLIRGELWIEPVTGAPVLVTGRLVKIPAASFRVINVVREITFVNGSPCARTTHMMIETQPVGRAELITIELPLRLPDPDAAPPSMSRESGSKDLLSLM